MPYPSTSRRSGPPQMGHYVFDSPFRQQPVPFLQGGSAYRCRQPLMLGELLRLLLQLATFATIGTANLLCLPHHQPHHRTRDRQTERGGRMGKGEEGWGEGGGGEGGEGGRGEEGKGEYKAGEEEEKALSTNRLKPGHPLLKRCHLAGQPLMLDPLEH